MQRRTLLTAALCGGLAALPAQAQPVWPTQTVKIVVPTGPGSSLDLIVRLMSNQLSARWGQPVVVDNKPGAGGMLGVDVAAKATDNLDAAAEIGFYYFAAYCLVSLLALQFMIIDPPASDAAPAPARQER